MPEFYRRKKISNSHVYMALELSTFIHADYFNAPTNYLCVKNNNKKEL